MAVVAAAVIAIAVVSVAVVWFSLEARPPRDDIETGIRCFHGFGLFVTLSAIVLAAVGKVDLFDSRVDLALFALLLVGAAAQVYQLRRRRSLDAKAPPGAG